MCALGRTYSARGEGTLGPATQVGEVERGWGTWGAVGVRSSEEACSGGSEGTSVLSRAAQGSGKWSCDTSSTTVEAVSTPAPAEDELGRAKRNQGKRSIPGREGKPGTTQ